MDHKLTTWEEADDIAGGCDSNIVDAAAGSVSVEEAGPQHEMCVQLKVTCI